MGTRGRHSEALMYLITFYEASLPTMLKLSHVLAGNAQQAVNDSILFSCYWMFIILSILQNKRRYVLLSGFTMSVEYTILILVSIFEWNVLIVSGRNSASPGPGQ